MEGTAKGIQMESVQQFEAPNADKPITENESPAKKASVFCFKKRKKCREKVMEKDEDCESDSLTLKPMNQQPNTGCSKVEVSDLLWTSGGTWLAFKRFVTSRRRPKSALKKQTQFGSRVQLETNVEDVAVLRFPKEGAGSSIKVPCLRFSRSRKKSSHPEMTEELECSEKANETASILNNQRNSKPEMVDVEAPVSTEEPPGRAVEEKEGDSGAVRNVEDVVASSREDTFAAEMRPNPNRYTDCAAQSEIIHSEKVLETEDEKQIFQLHHGSLYGNAEGEEGKKFDFQVETGPFVPQDLAESQYGIFGTEDTKNAPATEAELEQFARDAGVVADRDGARDGNSVEVMLHFSPPTLEDEASSELVCSDEEVKGKENKFAMPGAGIVIMITEAEDYPDEGEPSFVCEPFSFPQAGKQKGKKKTSRGLDSGAGGCSKPCSNFPLSFGANGQEHRTPEQHEVLLIETAASLVKAAIQSSIEQLINEMALEQNQQNSFL
ncbi:A-kinase anchor protein 5 [Elgaria multicarinata webbii]|uniref:A-kinase anchor protein 5 n=1 Tax=Elgaria multicarinata webbii TaxID=159646 RepID=UPI002FCD4C0C